MKRSLCVLGVGAFLGSVVTLTLVLWLQRGLQNAVAEEGEGAGNPSGNGDVNGDAAINITDAVYLLNWLFLGGPAPVPIVCPPMGLLATGQVKCYDNGAQQIPCDNVDFPGQDGFYQAGCQGEGRFVDNGDGTVTDTCTGLMWQKDTADLDGNGTIGGEDTAKWQDALKYCDSLTSAGHDDWRLPNVRELQSIVDYGRYSPAIDPVFKAESDWYWSSTSYAFDPDYAWVVSFYDAYAYDYHDKGNGSLVRAVRAGP